MWPLPWVCIAESWILHTVTLRGTFECEVKWKSFKRFRRYGADMKLNGESDYLKVWPWPWVCVAESRVLHTISLRGTFEWEVNENLSKGFGRYGVDKKVLQTDWLTIKTAIPRTPHQFCSRRLKLEANEAVFAQNMAVSFVQVIHFQRLIIVGTLKSMARTNF